MYCSAVIFRERRVRFFVVYEGELVNKSLLYNSITLAVLNLSIALNLGQCTSTTRANDDLVGEFQKLKHVRDLTRLSDHSISLRIGVR